MYLIIFIPILPTFTHYPPKFMFSFFIMTHWVQLLLPMYENMGHSWSMANLPGSILLKKTDQPSPTSHQTSIGHKLGMVVHKFFPNPCWNVNWLDFALGLGRHPRSLWGRECNGSVMSRRYCFYLVFPKCCLLNFLAPSSGTFFEPCDEVQYRCTIYS